MAKEAAEEAPKKPRGRRLQPQDVQEDVCELVRVGASYSLAAEFSGISKDTLYRWIARGEGRGRGRATPAHREFAKAIKKALRTRLIQSLEAIRQRAPGWQAAAWWLERRFPKEFARVVRQEFMVQSGQPAAQTDLTTDRAELRLIVGGSSAAGK